MKQEKSAEQNKARIERMVMINKLVEKLRGNSQQKLHEHFKENQQQYIQLLQSLLLQGLIKLCETKIKLVCRQEDVALIKSIIPQTVSQFKKKMIAEVKACQDKTEDQIKCEVVVDEKKFLEPWDTEKKAGCLGGFMMYTRKNRIVCSQKIDDRMELVFD